MLWTENRVAKETGFTESTLRTWRSRNREAGPPFVKFGRAVRYRPEDVRAWVQAQAALTAPTQPFD